MFNKADKNKDGKLTPEEWRQVLNASGVPTSMWVKLLNYKLQLPSNLGEKMENYLIYNIAIVIDEG